MKKLLLLFFGLSFIAFKSCITDSETPMCEDMILIDKDVFDNGPDDQLSITSVNITNDCLTVEFLSSGCDGKNWSIVLVDAGVVAESNPPQRIIRLSLDNPEHCRAGIIKKITFNLEPIRIYDANEVSLNLEGWEERIGYTY